MISEGKKSEKTRQDFCARSPIHQSFFSPLSRLDYFKRSYLYLKDGSVLVEDHQLEINFQKQTKRNKLSAAPTTP